MRFVPPLEMTESASVDFAGDSVVVDFRRLTEIDMHVVAKYSLMM